MKKLLIASATLSGTIIGAGILGLPYIFSQSGFFIGLLWLFFLFSIVLFSKLCLGEVILRTKGNHHLPGYAEKYIGKKGRIIMFFAMIFGSYSSLLAYLIGEGESLSVLFYNNSSYTFFFGLFFWLVMSFMLHEGLKGLKKFEYYGVLAIILLVIFFFIFYFSEINLDNLTYYNSKKIFLPFGVCLFAFLGFTSIPEMNKILKNSHSLLKKSIILGSFIPLIIYILFVFVAVNEFGLNLSEVATISFGKTLIVLGIFTMMTSFFVISFSLFEMYKEDFGFSNKKARIFSSIVPMALFVVVQLTNIFSFVQVLNISGIVSGGILGILILIMNIKSKKLGNRKPEYSMNVNFLIVLLLSILFLIAIIFQLKETLF